MPELQVAGTTVRFEMSGGGAAIVLLHGLYQDADCWTPLAEALSARYRVIRYDLRGCGRSGNGGAVTIERLAADLGVLLDTLEVGRVVIVGHSLGGQAALQFAVDHPERVRALVLAAVSPLAVDATMGPAYGVFAQVALATGLTDQLADAMNALVYSADSLDHGPAGEEVFRRQITLFRRPDEIVSQIQAYVGRASLEDRLSAVTCPTLIVTGDLDTTVSLASPMLMNANIAGSELIVLPDASHMAPLERADQFKLALMSFLARVGA